MLTTLLAMCAPAPAWVASEYTPLFPARGSPVPSKLQLLTAFRKALRDYKGMLQKFLRTEDDQVRQ
jgi:translation initiation factor eIF-2B subunit epsilon